MDSWCASGDVPRGATITLEKCWDLARSFYGDRLSALATEEPGRIRGLIRWTRPDGTFLATDALMAGAFAQATHRYDRGRLEVTLAPV